MNKAREIEDKINNIVGVLNQKREQIPHVKNKKTLEDYKKENDLLVKELKKIKKENKRKEGQVNSLRNKNKKLDSQNKTNIKKIANEVEEKGILKNKLIKKEKQVNYLEDFKEKLEEENTKLKGTNRKYKEDIRKIKKEEKYIPAYKEKIKVLEEEREEEVGRLNKVIKELERKGKEHKRHIRGHVRALKSERREVRELDAKIGKLTNKMSHYKRDIKIKDQELDRMRNNPVEKYVEKSIGETIKDLTEKITKDNLVEYKGIGKLNGVLKDKEEERRKDKMYIGEYYGTMYIKNGEVYVRNIDNKEENVVTHLNDFGVVNGKVCKYIKYKGGKTEVIDVYEESDLNKFRNQSKGNIKNKKVKGGKVNTFKGDLKGLNVILLSGKQVQIYNRYFNGDVTVIDPFTLGTMRIFNEVDKADIVIMRMDAISHNISDYVKEHKKGSAIFLETSNLFDVNMKLNNMIKSIV